MTTATLTPQVRTEPSTSSPAIISIRESGSLAFPAGCPPTTEAAPRTFRVTLIKEGIAKTGRYYPAHFIHQVAAAAEGLRAFADHPTPTEDRERPVRSVRDVVGFYKDARAEETTDADGQPLVQATATLHLFESASWLAAVAREALSAGYPDLIGLSIDSLVHARIGRPPGAARDLPIAEQLVELKSVDVVTRPSAGGEFLSLQESFVPETETINQSIETQTALDVQAPTSPDVGPVSDTAIAAVAQAESLLAQVRESQLALECRQTLAERLGTSPLPAPVVSRLRQQWAYAPGRWTSTDDYTRQLESALSLEVTSLSQLRDLFSAPAEDANTAPHPIDGYGDLRVNTSGVEKQRVLAQVAMDRLIGCEGADDDPDWRRAREIGVLTGAPRWSGIREAYVALTGDSAVSGQIDAALSIAREANEVTSGVLNHALLNSMTKRLIRDYRGQQQTWRKFCSVTPIQNFKSQDRVRLHDFSSLSTVAEGASYTNLAWDDSREAYAAAKRGNLVVVTREAIVNDDLRAIRRIPEKIARAAYITINEFVYGLFTGNPTMNDSTKVFDDGVQTSHGNRGTSALSSSALQAAITSMMKQTDTAGKRLNLKPRYLLVPADLLFTSLTIVNSTLTPGTANNDANVLKGAVEPIPVAQFTDPTDWYLICDPQDIESIEIGFVGGREDPELLLQDAPLLGQVFTNDQLSYKVRWEFGGTWLDYRGAFWSQAAG